MKEEKRVHYFIVLTKLKLFWSIHDILEHFTELEIDMVNAYYISTLLSFVILARNTASNHFIPRPLLRL